MTVNHPPNTIIDPLALELVEAWNIQHQYLRHNIKWLSTNQATTTAALLVIGQQVGHLAQTIADEFEDRHTD